MGGSLLHLGGGLLLDVLAAVLHDHLGLSEVRCVRHPILRVVLHGTTRIDPALVIEVVHELLELARTVHRLGVLTGQGRVRVRFHRLAVLSVECLLLLLVVLLLLLNEALAGGEAVGGCVEADVDLVVGHGEVAEVQIDHVVAEGALLGQLPELVLALALDRLHLLLHLLEC